MWSKSDARFLRSLRIESTNPPAPLPRFRVEPSDIEGGYRVIDSNRKHRSVYEVDQSTFNDPRAAAEDIAAQMNAKHVEAP
jgi:hypothetical protein